MNNNSNNCGDCGTTCSECGRPWAICKQDGGCGCNKCKDIKFCEYGRMANGCVREKQPGCPMQAVIPSVTVESIEGIKNLADCLVHVSDINTTFYIDDKHRPIITWAGPIDIPGYDMEGNPNNYRDQIVTDVANQMAVIYDKSGKGYMFGLAENIDLQEQVNNKLDQMAKDGSLQEIISRFLELGALVVFNTLSDAVSSSNLTEGAIFKTLGKNEVNDGNGAYYKVVTTETDVELSNHLYATLIRRPNSDSYYYDINTTKERINDTDVYFTTIPVGKKLKVKQHLDRNPFQYACDEHTTLTINGGLNLGGKIGVGSVISDGEIIRDIDTSTIDSKYPYVYLGIKEDGSIVEYPMRNTTATLMLNQGCKQVINAYYPLIHNGVGLNVEDYIVDDQVVVNNPHPRQALATLNDGSIIMLTCDGRTAINKGLTSTQLVDILLSKGALNAWNLDGGGSTCTVLRGYKVNRDIDNAGTSVRNIHYSINVEDDIKDLSLADLKSDVGKAIESQASSLTSTINQKIGGYSEKLDSKDLDTLIGRTIVGYGNRDVHRPVGISSSAYFVNIPHSDISNANLYNHQLYVSRDHSNELYSRVQTNGTFSDWRRFNATAKLRQKAAHTIQADNTYEDIALLLVTSNDSTFITLDDNNNVIINDDQYFRVNVALQFKTATVTGTKYVQIKIAGTSVPFRFTGTAGTETPVSFEHVARNNSTATTPVSIQCYGSVGDKIERVYVTIQKL